MREAAQIAKSAGLQPWGKPSGRWAAGRPHFRESDYGVWANIMAGGGQNIQTQGSCRDQNNDGSYVTGPADFKAAVDSIISQYRAAGATSHLFVQVTTSSEKININATPPDEAFECALVGWGYPEVERVTLWSAPGDRESANMAERFLQLWERRLDNQPRPPSPTPPAPPTPTPPLPPALPIPGRIQAEDYKPGGEGVGYHDTTPGNSGGAYRSDDVDIQVATDAGGGHNIGWTRQGEWLAFNVQVAQAGNYDITARVASATAGTKSLHIEVDGVAVTGPMSFTDASGWQSWLDVKVPEVNLPAGPHALRIVMDSDFFNVNYIDVMPSANQAPSATIASPGDGASFLTTDTINFSGSATDFEDGDLTQSLVWTSSMDGQIGTGGSVQASLSASDHVITLAATDSQGASGSDAVNITVVNVVSGDANQDGQFTGEDIYLVVDWVIGRQPMPQAGAPAFVAADVDSDGSITAQDVALMIERLSGALNQSPL